MSPFARPSPTLIAYPLPGLPRVAVAGAPHPPGQNPVPASCRADRIARGLPFWSQISSPSDKFVLRQIRFGFRLNWLAGPPAPLLLPNQPSAFQHADFVSSEVTALLAAKAVSISPEKPHCVFPLGVVPKPRSRKLRLILDMRLGNESMPDMPFRTLRTLNSLPV